MVRRSLITLALAIVIFAFLVLQDLLGLGAPGGRIFLTRTDLIAVIGGFALALALSRPSLVNIALLCLIGLPVILASAYRSYFGGDMEPFHVTLLFAETADVFEATSEAAGRHLGVVVTTLLPLIAIGWLIVKTRERRATLPGVWLVALIILAVAPVRVAVKADTLVFSPDPAKPFLINTLQTFSYAGVSALGLVERPDIVYQPYRVTAGPAPEPPPTIIVVIGEGIAPARMQIFGSTRETTPSLASWRPEDGAGTLLASRGFSSAVATQASVMLFLNGQREPTNEQVTQSKTTNLFRLARERGYATAYLSAQKANTLAGSGREFIEAIMTVDDHRDFFATRGDMGLVEWLEAAKVPPDSGRFIVIQQRNIHGPYDRNYAHAPEFVKWPFDGLKRPHYDRNAYDNGLLYYDAFLSRLARVAFDRFAQDGPLYVFATSDHGQVFGAGEDRWGHSFLIPEVADVPFLLFTNRPNGPIASAFKSLEVPTHYRIARLIAEAMGFEIDNPNDDQVSILVNGPLRLGRGGYMRLEADQWPGPVAVEVYDAKGDRLRDWHQPSARHGPH